MGLKISKLNVQIDDKKILNDYDLNIGEGEIHAIMGPNGSGKSTLSKTIMGDSHYRVTSGEIIYNDENILSLSVDERAHRGIFLCMQAPIDIDGVSNADFLRTALSSKKQQNINLYEFANNIEHATEDLKMDNKMIHRSINVGFSGGERKKNEILQMKILEPSLVILDELDSGLDIDSLKIVADNIIDYKKTHPQTSFLIITHHTHILEYIKPDYVHVMVQGHIIQTGSYQLALDIEKEGYNGLSVMKENA